MDAIVIQGMINIALGLTTLIASWIAIYKEVKELRK
jgi:hypothetical protein